MWNVGDGHASFICCDYKSQLRYNNNLSSLQSTMLCCSFFTSIKTEVGLHGGQRKDSCLSSARTFIKYIHLFKKETYFRILQLICVGLVCSDSSQAINNTCYCWMFHLRERIHPLSLRKRTENIFFICTKTQSKCITLCSRHVFS